MKTLTTMICEGIGKAETKTEAVSNTLNILDKVAEDCAKRAKRRNFLLALIAIPCAIGLVEHVKEEAKREATVEADEKIAKLKVEWGINEDSEV